MKKIGLNGEKKGIGEKIAMKYQQSESWKLLKM